MKYKVFHRYYFCS